MLDMAGIVISTVMVLVVIVRAAQRDQSQPWFQAIKARTAGKHEKPGGWRRK